VIHGTTLTSHPAGEWPGAAATLDVNLMGTVAVLDWARHLPALRRIMYVSSGAVYPDAATEPPPDRVDETTPVEPDSMYAISKYAGERVATRYAALVGRDVVIVRLGTVYGPMDRRTATRDVESIPYRVASLALDGQLIAVDSLEEGGDWLHASDAAAALVALLRRPRLEHSVYNVAYGEIVPVGVLLRIAAQALPGTSYVVVAPEQATLLVRPPHRGPAWCAYDISRLRGELAWRPRPVQTAFRDYLDWSREQRSAGAAA
jgi:UDP-glucose 4-epimerase